MYCAGNNVSIFFLKLNFLLFIPTLFLNSIILYWSVRPKKLGNIWFSTLRWRPKSNPNSFVKDYLNFVESILFYLLATSIFYIYIYIYFFLKLFHLSQKNNFWYIMMSHKLLWLFWGDNMWVQHSLDSCLQNFKKRCFYSQIFDKKTLIKSNSICNIKNNLYIVPTAYQIFIENS